MSTRGQGSTRNWRRTRQQVLDRDHYECQARFTGCTGVAIEVHHKVGIAAQGLARRDADGEPEECISVCPSCHATLTERQRKAGAARAQMFRHRRKRLPQKPHPGEMR
jgi:5-methylcytosine-specific restriction enzyme A